MLIFPLFYPTLLFGFVPVRPGTFSLTLGLPIDDRCKDEGGHDALAAF